MAAKDDVTFEEEIKKLLTDNQEYLIDDLKDAIQGIDLTKYTSVINDEICDKIYGSLKKRRNSNNTENNTEEERIQFLNDSNKFAAWIYEGRRESLSNANKLDAFKITEANELTFSDHLKPLFTDCDEWNMKQQQRPTIDIQLHDYDNVNKHNKPIIKLVKERNMPPGAPWTDEQINTLTAWILDGMQPGTPVDILSPIRPFYPKDITPGDDGYPDNPDQLTFDDHVRKMFTEGHQKRMIKHSVGNSEYKEMPVDLSDYTSVTYHKVNILDRLTYPNKSKRMPKNNPWPMKNIKLFHAWAKQGINPKKDRRSPLTESDRYKPDDQVLTTMQEYVNRYSKDPDAPKDSEAPKE